MKAADQIRADVGAWIELPETTSHGEDYGHAIYESLAVIEAEPMVTIRKGDLVALKTAFHVCSNIATGGEMFIDGRKDYISAASSLAGLVQRAEESFSAWADKRLEP